MVRYGISGMVPNVVSLICYFLFSFHYVHYFITHVLRIIAVTLIFHYCDIFIILLFPFVLTTIYIKTQIRCNSLLFQFTKHIIYRRLILKIVA